MAGFLPQVGPEGEVLVLLDSSLGQLGRVARTLKQAACSSDAVSLLELPGDLLLGCLAELSLGELAAFGNTCAAARGAADTGSLWLRRCPERFRTSSLSGEEFNFYKKIVLLI